MALLRWKPEWNALLGTATDMELGPRLGVCPETVGHRRRALGIPVCPRVYNKNQVPHEVHCLGCGTAMKRATYWKEPKCPTCRHKRWLKYNKDQRGLLRHQSRRYRIIMHVLGWEEYQFAEMLAEMRASPMAFRRSPETRAARVDLRWERKKARAA